MQFELAERVVPVVLVPDGGAVQVGDGGVSVCQVHCQVAGGLSHPAERDLYVVGLEDGVERGGVRLSQSCRMKRSESMWRSSAMARFLAC
ncbi:hypothetical protein ACFWVU_25280 [Streptomyces sp. NPDC058686]|uniref:hypothetical protein n=1 Tax=Streptomyces sp. NPDC058686 TaxID=3346599 RepID=UPI00364C57FD